MPTRSEIVIVFRLLVQNAEDIFIRADFVFIAGFIIQIFRDIPVHNLLRQIQQERGRELTDELPVFEPFPAVGEIKKLPGPRNGNIKKPPFLIQSVFPQRALVGENILFHADDENHRPFQSFRRVNRGHDRRIFLLILFGAVIFIHQGIAFHKIQQRGTTLVLLRKRKFKLTDVIQKFHYIVEPFFRLVAILVNPLHSVQIADLVEIVFRARGKRGRLLKALPERGKCPGELLRSFRGDRGDRCQKHLFGHDLHQRHGRRDLLQFAQTLHRLVPDSPRRNAENTQQTLIVALIHQKFQISGGILHLFSLEELLPADDLRPDSVLAELLFKDPGKMIGPVKDRTILQIVLPARGKIAVFNRSYYEECLVVRVRGIWRTYRMPARCLDMDEDQYFSERFEDIRCFERYLTRMGHRVVKLFLNVSAAKQRERFLERIDDVSKNWKFSESDLSERLLWSDYQRAYEEMIAGTATKRAPWYVIPADQKWVARALVSQIILDTLEDIDPHYPALTKEQRGRLAACRDALVTGPAADVDR